MAFIPLLRVVLFTLITLLSCVVVGICVHIEVLAAGNTEYFLSFTPFGIGAGCLTIISLPLFLALGRRRNTVFTATILFEIVWFFVLWALWVGTASDTLADKAYHFPSGCVYDGYPTVNQVCHEFTVVEVAAYLNFICAFVYYDVLFLYAIVNAIRGRSVWTASVREATQGVPGVAAPMMQPPQAYGAYPQSYGAYPQAPPSPYAAYTQLPAPQPYGYPQAPVPAPPPYGYLQPPAAPAPPLYGYPQPSSPASHPQAYHAAPAPPLPPQAPYAPENAPQPNYGAYPVEVPHAPLPLPSGYAA